MVWAAIGIKFSHGLRNNSQAVRLAWLLTAMIRLNPRSLEFSDMQIHACASERVPVKALNTSDLICVSNLAASSPNDQ